MESLAEKFVALSSLLAIDLLFLIPFVLLLLIIKAWKPAAFAVLKRNFLAYFTNPTGYVFLCLFVWLSSIAAFWTEDFFAANLANLDQLNRHLPLIMLVFIPAITMSIWAEERRQGTDELLLTIPADDFDIVLGKYLASVSIFTVSLLFSQIAIFLVLISLGEPDIGLFVGNYFGYWMVGVAMLSLGMVASFLTSNLTVGFILGVILCAPLVFSASAAVVFNEELGRKLAAFSITEQFRDFESGVISFAGIVFFLMVIVVSLYLCMVLIGRRHWSGGKDGRAMGGHYLVRVVALAVIAGSISVAAAALPLFRWDVTSERLSSLSGKSTELIDDVVKSESKYVIKIEAFISKDLPEEFVQRRFDLLSTLREIKAEGGDKIKLRVYDGIDLFGEVANRAQTYYGIEKQTVDTKVRGAATSTDIIFGVAFESALERAIIPFLGASLPIEYELIRSLATVTQQERKKVGVLQTDANLMSASSTMRPGQSERPVIEELKKQYEVVSVDPTDPIEEEFDVLVAVQPSSLSEPQMQNFIDAVKRGQPTAIFEDPFPVTSPAPGTSRPKRRPQGMMSQFSPPPEQKGNIQPLWDLLGLKMVSQQPERTSFGRPAAEEAMIVWQEYNPHPEDSDLQNEFVWITPNCGGLKPFSNTEAVVSGLQKLLLLYPGGVEDNGTDKDREFEALVTTGGRNSGTVTYDNCLEFNVIGQPYLKGREDLRADETVTSQEYILAARVHQKAKPSEDSAVATDDKEGETDAEDDDSKPAEPKDINVIFVADIDVLSGFFFELRERGEIPGMPMVAKWDLDNVPFVLNILDRLAGDERFIDVRKRRRVHRELTAVKRLGDDAKQARNEARKTSEDKFKKAIKDEEDKYEDVYKKLRNRKNVSQQQIQEELAIARKSGSERIEAKKAQVDREQAEEFRQIENDMAAKVHTVQDRYKMLAVLLPPIPPLLIAICVFFVRRSREREGVSKDRLVRV